MRRASILKSKASELWIIEPTDDLPMVAQHERFEDDLEAMVERVAETLPCTCFHNTYDPGRAVHSQRCVELASRRARSLILGETT